MENFFSSDAYLDQSLYYINNEEVSAAVNKISNVLKDVDDIEELEEGCNLTAELVNEYLILKEKLDIHKVEYQDTNVDVERFMTLTIQIQKFPELFEEFVKQINETKRTEWIRNLMVCVKKNRGLEIPTTYAFIADNPLTKFPDLNEILMDKKMCQICGLNVKLESINECTVQIEYQCLFDYFTKKNMLNDTLAKTMIKQHKVNICISFNSFAMLLRNDIANPVSIPFIKLNNSLVIDEFLCHNDGHMVEFFSESVKRTVSQRILSFNANNKAEKDVSTDFSYFLFNVNGIIVMFRMTDLFKFPDNRCLLLSTDETKSLKLSLLEELGIVNSNSVYECNTDVDLMQRSCKYSKLQLVQQPIKIMDLKERIISVILNLQAILNDKELPSDYYMMSTNDDSIKLYRSSTDLNAVNLDLR